MFERIPEGNKQDLDTGCWQDVRGGWNKWGNRAAVKREQFSWLILWWTKGGVLFALTQ